MDEQHRVGAIATLSGRAWRLGVVGCFALLAGCSRAPEPAASNAARPVPLVQVETADAGSAREFSGRVEQTNVSPLAFEVAGRVTDIAVRDGALVRRGDIIAQLDPEPYELALRRARIQQRQLAADLVRKRRLREDGILPAAAYEQLEAGVQLAQVQLDQAQRDMRNTRLVAPFDGRLSARAIEEQQVVAAGQPVFRLENLQRFDLGVDLPQALVQNLRLDDSLSAVARLPGSAGKEIPLVYREHAAQGVLGGGVYRLVFSGERPQQSNLLPGMAVRVTLSPGAILVAPPALLAVPLSALAINADGTASVWRLDEQGGSVHAVAVDIAEIAGTRALVQGKLHAGERVVAAGTGALREGMQVVGQGER